MGTTTAVTELVTARGRTARTVLAMRRFLDEVVEQSRGCYLAAMRRVAVRQQLHRVRRDHPLDRARSRAHAHEAPAVTFVRQLVRLWEAGATAAELVQLASYPLRAINQLIAEVRPLEVLDLEETRIDGEEDLLQMRRALRGRANRLTPAGLREEAAACGTLSALYLERERALLAEATRLEQTGGLVA